MMLEITPIPAFKDNYIWMLSKDQQAVIVDPGDASVVISELEKRRFGLRSILITHHHADHIGGVAELLAYQSCQVYAPENAMYTFPHQVVREGDLVDLDPLELSLEVIAVPGHTLDHIAYYGEGLLFCGDTLFGAGCGRLFEGTPSQMYGSLQKLAALPAETRIFCTHEYTEHNIRFAITVDPHNAALRQRQAAARALREHDLPTLPSTLQLELETNPFLRCQQAELQKAAHLQTTDPVEVFAALRELRNHY